MLALSVICQSLVLLAAEAVMSCPAEGPWVRLDGGDVALGSMASAVRVRLASDLGHRGLSVCSASSGGRPEAVVSLLPSGSARITVAVAFATTDFVRPLESTVDLSSIPEDGQPLAIAAVAAEMLRATPGPTEPVPFEETTTAVAAPMTAAVAVEPAAPDWEAEAGIAVTQFLTGQTSLGPDLRVRRWISPRLALVVGGAFREGLARTSEHGSVDTAFVGAHAALDLALRDRGRKLGVSLSGFTEGGLAIFRAASSGEGARAADARLPVLTAGVALSSRWRFGSSFFAGFRVAGFLTPVYARAADDDRLVTRLEGPGLDVSLMTGGVF